VTVLAETAERADEINVRRAEEAKQRAEERLKSADPNTDFDRAEQALQRADARLQVAGKSSS
jgi:F-type H+-transporting ATPase subunit epsilon